MSDFFTCFVCRQTFKKGWTDEDAEKEYRETYGENIGEETEVLCDDCHSEFMRISKNKKGFLQ